MYRLHQTMFKVSIQWKGTNYTVTDLCEHLDPSLPQVCRYYSVLDFWRFNETAMAADPNPTATVSQGNGKTSFGQPLPYSLVLGGMSFHANSSLSQATAFKSIIYADTSIVLTSSNPDWLDIVDAWEETLVDQIKEFSANSPLLEVSLVLQVSFAGQVFPFALFLIRFG